jgi:hypothetical protein
MHLRPVSSDAVETLRRYEPELLSRTWQEALGVLCANPDPIHLVLLYALFHATQWQQPQSDAAALLRNSCGTAMTNFLQRPEFTWNAFALGHRESVRWALQAVCRRIWREGFHSLGPTPPWLRWPGQPALLIHDFEHAQAAIDCASSVTALPMSRFLRAASTPLRADAYPSESEQENCNALLLKFAALQAAGLRNYERDPAFCRVGWQEESESSRKKARRAKRSALQHA